MIARVYLNHHYIAFVAFGADLIVADCAVVVILLIGRLVHLDCFTKDNIINFFGGQQRKMFINNKRQQQDNVRFSCGIQPVQLLRSSK